MGRLAAAVEGAPFSYVPTPLASECRPGEWGTPSGSGRTAIVTTTKERRRCTARSKRSGVQCKRLPSPGAVVCVIHGSRSPQAMRKASARVAEQDALRLLRSVDIVPVGDPLTALQLLAGEILAWKTILAGKVGDLKGDYRYSHLTGEQARAEVVLFERALDRCNTVLSSISKLNIDDRLARVREREADMFEKAMNAAMTKMGLTDDQQRDARQIIAAEVRAITSG